jgi:hypothetical protein
MFSMSAVLLLSAAAKRASKLSSAFTAVPTKQKVMAIAAVIRVRLDIVQSPGSLFCGVVRKSPASLPRRFAVVRLVTERLSGGGPKLLLEKTNLFLKHRICNN